MNLVCRTIGVFLIAVAGVFSVSGQEVPKDQSTQPLTVTTETPNTQISADSLTAAPTQTPTPDYVFPTPGERAKRYVKSMFGPGALLRTTASAGISQWRDTPEEWGQGMEGYGRRFASGFGKNVIQQTVTYGLDSAFKLDTGFQRSKREGFWPRLKDALVQNVTSRTHSGKRVVSAPRLAGVYTAAIVATETWYPDRYDYKDGVRHGSITLLTGFGINVVREFFVNF
jgi:hypothetical protein